MTQSSEEMISFAVGLAFAFGALYHLERWERSQMIRDRYKPGEPELPSLGGLMVLLGWLLVIMMVALGWGLTTGLILFILTALACSAMGLVDDLRGVSQPTKAFLPLVLGVPLAFYVAGNPDSWASFAENAPALLVGVGVLLYLSLGTNLTNMHAGFNGLATGNSLIMLLAVAYAISWAGEELRPQYLYGLAGGTAALLWFNRYPARIIEGNVGSHLWGGAIAAALLLEGFWLEGLVLFAPQLVDFGLWGYARLRRYPFQKYAPLVDGRIRPDDPFKLKFLVARWFPREWQAVLVLWGLQALAAIAFIGLVAYTHPLLDIA